MVVRGTDDGLEESMMTAATAGIYVESDPLDTWSGNTVNKNFERHVFLLCQTQYPYRANMIAMALPYILM